MASSSSASSLACWSAALRVEAGYEPVPLGLGLMLVLGGLPAGFVACPPPVQRLGAGHGDGATILCPGGGGGGVHERWPGTARPGTVGARAAGQGAASRG
jgi:hypothetical protein